MSEQSGKDLVVRALRGERTPRTPVWLMRQAGRSDPEYLRLRDESGLPLHDLFRHPEWAARLSLLPRRFGVDAIIFYQDILTPLAPMGAEFVFVPAPALRAPLDLPHGLDRVQPFDVPAGVPFVGDTLDRLRDALGGALPVLGFAGAPFTLAVFICEGGSFGHDIARTRAVMRDAPHTLHALLGRLTAMTIDYLRYQAAHGVAAVQLFESAAFCMTRGEYAEWALPYQQRIFAALRGIVPTIVFAREWPHLGDLDAAGADVISLPAQIGIAEARAQLGAHRVLQGNLDNTLLAHGPWEEVEAKARQCLREGASQGHIFNLSHGLLRDTPFDRVARLVDLVRTAGAQTA